MDKLKIANYLVIKGVKTCHFWTIVETLFSMRC